MLGCFQFALKIVMAVLAGRGEDRPTMTTLCVSMALLMGMMVGAAGGAPTAEEVQEAMNDGIQLEHARWREFSDLKVQKGGVTSDGSFLYLCRVKVVWKVDSETLMTGIKEDLSAQTGGGKGLVESLGSMALAMVATRVGEFEKGGLVLEHPVRVRLVKAGSNWIVIDSVAGKAGVNPLDEIDLSGGRSKK